MDKVSTDPNSTYQQLVRQYNQSLLSALGLTPDVSQTLAAEDWARQNINNPLFKDKTFDELVKMAEDDLINEEAARRGLDDLLKEQQQKLQEQTQDGGPKKEEQKPQTPMSIMQSLLQLMQKIEPRIPVENLA